MDEITVFFILFFLYSPQKKLFLFQWLCFIIDCFCFFSGVSWVFYTNNKKNNNIIKIINIFGWIWIYRILFTSLPAALYLNIQFWYLNGFQYSYYWIGDIIHYITCDNIYVFIFCWCTLGCFLILFYTSLFICLFLFITTILTMLFEIMKWSFITWIFHPINGKLRKKYNLVDKLYDLLILSNKINNKLIKKKMIILLRNQLFKHTNPLLIEKKTLI